MQSHEKNKPNSAVLLKQKLFDRHLLELSKWKQLVKQEYPVYTITPLQSSGIAARLSLFNEWYGFADVESRLHKLTSFLNSYMVNESNTDMRLQISWYIQDVQHLSILFNWLSHYGPSPNS